MKNCKLMSWNVNGLRAVIKKGYLNFIEDSGAKIFCIQETKMQEGQTEVLLPGYFQYWNSADKKGYSGTAVFCKDKPLSVKKGIGMLEHDLEGRVLTLAYDNFYLVNCYTPNAQKELARIDYRMEWDEAFRQYVKQLDHIKPVIICGDLNVAHDEIDLKNPKSNRGNAGFSDGERTNMTKLLDAGFVDTFRHLYPEKKDAYTWWSYLFHAREKNAGWRIDYFLVSERLMPQVKDHIIRSDVMGSDHCPIELILEI